MALIWIIPLLGVAAGGFELYSTMRLATSAPQQAAGAAMSLCYVVLPYVFARALEGIAIASWRVDMLAATSRRSTTKDNDQVSPPSMKR